MFERILREIRDKIRQRQYVMTLHIVSCPNCGERYFTAETLHEIERIKLHKQSFANKRPVAIAEFA